MKEGWWDLFSCPTEKNVMIVVSVL